LDQVNQGRLHIVQIGEEVLWTAANELSRKEIPSAKTQELIEHMRDTMHSAPGVGLAGVLYVDRMRTPRSPRLRISNVSGSTCQRPTFLPN
jgi:hypothetical protein